MAVVPGAVLPAVLLPMSCYNEAIGQPHSAKKFYGTFYFFWLTFIYSAESMTPDESLPTKQTVVFLNFIGDFNAKNCLIIYLNLTSQIPSLILTFTIVDNTVYW